MDRIRKTAIGILDAEIRYEIKNDLTDRVHAEFSEYDVPIDDVFRIVCDVVDQFLVVNESYTIRD